MDDTHFMKMALDLAQKGQGYTSPNPMVGAVVVSNGQVVGKGYHEAAGQAHAEVNALDAAGDLAKGATLYVTLEPCNHTGRTPPCTEKILSAGIQRVVVAAEDVNPSVKGGGVARLRKHGVEVTTGVCKKQASRLNEVFEKYTQTGRPFVILNRCPRHLSQRNTIDPEVLSLAEHDCRSGRIDRNHESGLSDGHAQPAALADRESDDAIVLAQFGA